MKSITITEHTLKLLASRPDLVKHIPALAGAAVKPANKCCNRSSGYRQTLNQLKNRLVGLPAAQKALLRRALGADELVIFVATQTGSRRVVL
jgi:hypothetical protein